MKRMIGVVMFVLLVSWMTAYALDTYEIEVSHNDEFFIINGEKFEAKTYCFDMEEGDAVSVVGLRGREVFKTRKGLRALGPWHFGYNIPYVPIEKVMAEGRT